MKGRKKYDWVKHLSPERQAQITHCGIKAGGIVLHCCQLACQRCRFAAARTWLEVDEALLAGHDRLRCLAISVAAASVADVADVIRRSKARLRMFFRRRRDTKIMARGIVDCSPQADGTWMLHFQLIVALGRADETRLLDSLMGRWARVEFGDFRGNFAGLYWPLADVAGVYGWVSGVSPRDPVAVGTLLSVLRGRQILRLQFGDRRKRPLLAPAPAPAIEPMPITF